VMIATCAWNEWSNFVKAWSLPWCFVVVNFAYNVPLLASTALGLINLVLSLLLFR